MNEKLDKELSVGDVVELKSGSFLMTILDVNEGVVTCVWQDTNDKICRERFPPLVLRLTD